MVCYTFGLLICEGLRIVRKRAKTTILRDIYIDQQHKHRFIYTFNYSPCFPQFDTFLVENLWKSILTVSLRVIAM